jgi:hypothetical protein
MTYRYGTQFVPQMSDTAIELVAFRDWFTEETGGLGRYAHMRKAMQQLFPDREWTSWDDLRARAFCNPDYWVHRGESKFHFQGNVGCASSGKTDFWGTAAYMWWLCDPLNSAVVITSIQKAMIRQRSWAVIQRCFHTLGDRGLAEGNFVDSRMVLQAQKGDDKHSIMAIAVGTGETQKAMQRLAGIHTDRIMVVIDEAPGTPEAIFHVMTNMRKGAREFVLVAAGNAISRMDAHGRVCEPKDGWNSVDENTEAWETKGVAEWAIDPGVCLHFHGKRSPNVKRKKTIYPFLYTLEDHQAAQGKEDTLHYWIYDAGFWAPEGISNTVLDEPMILKSGARDRVTWDAGVEGVAALDPAFGGDECVLRFGKIGNPIGGPKCLQVEEKVPILLKQKSPYPVDYQIARQVMAACRKRNVEPKNFVIGATGTGRGVAAILEAEWSPFIVKVEEGGKPSSTPVSASDGTLCADVYDRKITELWMNVREILLGGQLKGLDMETCVQFCKRTYTVKGRKYSIEKKDEFKARVGRSPDDADCVALMVELARQRGLVFTGIPREKSLTDMRLKAAREIDELYQEDGVKPGEGWMEWLED